MSPATPPDERFIVCGSSAGDMGLVADLKSGAYALLNGSALRLWREFLGGSSETTLVQWVSHSAQMPVDEARSVVRDTLTLVAATPLDSHPDRADLILDETNNRFRVHANQSFTLEFDKSTRCLRLGGEGKANEVATAAAFLAAKVLAVAGLDIVHASAVSAGAGIILFMGASGAGKSTWAHAACASTNIFAEDKVFLDRSDGLVRARELRSESVESWARRIAGDLLAGRDVELVRPLFAPESWPVVAAFFLDRNKRSGQRAIVAPLNALQATPLVIPQIFVGSCESLHLRRTLELAIHLAESWRIYALSAPEGVDQVRSESPVLLRRLQVEGHLESGLRPV